VSARRLRVELAPSASLTIGLLASHAAAALAALAVMPGAAGAAVGTVLVALGCAAAWGRALHRMPSSVRAVELAGAGVQIELASGERLSAEPAARRYVARYLVLIPLRRPVRRTMLLTRDMTDADSFRRLRIWALWGRVPGVAGKQLAA
jgi:hypothetical protein